MPENFSRRFTLIEMLVVISIIAILAGMITPALVKARQTTNRISCANQQKQIMTAFITYAHDFHDYFPLFNVKAAGWDGNRGYGFYTNILVGNNYLPAPGKWQNEYEGQMADGIMVCPQRGVETQPMIGALESESGLGIFYNKSGTKHLRLSKVRRPSQRVLLIDSAAAIAVVAPDHKYNNNYSVEWNPDTPGKRRASLRHNGGSNGAFIDVHIENRPFESWKLNTNDCWGLVEFYQSKGVNY